MDMTLKQAINKCIDCIKSDNILLQEIGIDIMTNTLKMKPKQIVYLLLVRGLLFNNDTIDGYTTGFVGEMIYNNKSMYIKDTDEETYHKTAVIHAEINFLNHYFRIMLLEDSVYQRIYYKVFFVDEKTFTSEGNWVSKLHNSLNVYESTLFKFMVKLIENYITPVEKESGIKSNKK